MKNPLLKNYTAPTSHTRDFTSLKCWINLMRWLHLHLLHPHHRSLNLQLALCPLQQPFRYIPQEVYLLHQLLPMPVSLRWVTVSTAINPSSSWGMCNISSAWGVNDWLNIDSSASPFFSTSILGAICTSACASSLQSHRSNIVSACGDYMLPGPNNISYAREFTVKYVAGKLNLRNTSSLILATVAVDTISGPYQQQCLTDSWAVILVLRKYNPHPWNRSTGLFCNEVLPAYNTASGLVLGYANSELCTSCVLGTLQITLENPLSFSQSVFSTLQTALGTCGSWAWTVS